MMEENFKLLQENNPEIEFQLYDEKEARLFIKNNFDSDVLDAYDRLAPSSYKSDLWRGVVRRVRVLEAGSDQESEVLGRC